jgi:hypothetical protein
MIKKLISSLVRFKKYLYLFNLRRWFFINYLKKNLGKRIDTEKLHAQAKNKRSHMSVTTSPLFIQTKSAFNELCKEYFKKYQ